MAGKTATDDDLGSGPDLGIQEDGQIDQAVDDLRGVLKKDAGELPLVGAEDLNNMGGAQAFGSDFGSDFPDMAAPGGADAFGAGAAAGSDFGMGDFGSDFGAATPDFGAAAPDFGAIDSGPAIGPTGQMTRADLVLDIPVDVQIILGTSRMAVSALMDLSEGATIALDRRIGEPVDIMVNGKLIGRGEITVLDTDETRFGVRMIEVLGAPAKKG